MASGYPLPGSIIQRICRRCRATDRLCLALLCSLALTVPAGAAPATESAAHALLPYTAQYRTSARGFDLEVTRELRLSDSGDGSYVLTSGGSLLVAGFHEVSVFRVEDDRIQPVSYTYRGTGLVSRHLELRFPPAAGAIKSLYKDRWYELPNDGNTLDRINQLEQLRLSLLADAAPTDDLDMRVADGKRIKASQLVFVGEETLPTPLGPVHTLHFERLHDASDRRSDIWLAPAWDYLMVKTVHVEDGRPMTMELTDATLAGQPLAAR